MLFAFSCLATCSVADCERKHGQHRNMCAGGQGHPLTFMSMLINSVNDEIRQISLRLQQDAKKRAQATPTELEDVAAGAIQPSSRTRVQSMLCMHSLFHVGISSAKLLPT